MKALLPTAIGSVVLLASSLSQADQVVSYPFDGTVQGSSPYFASASSSAAAVAADPLEAGSGLILNGPVITKGITINFSGWNGSSEDYFRWGFDVLPGFQIDLSTFSIHLARSSAGPTAIQIGASINQQPELQVFETTLSSGLDGTPYSNRDLSSLPSLAPGDSIVFTLRGTGGNGTSGTLRFESPLEVYGTVNQSVAAIPEPSAFLFGLVAALGAAVCRMRSGRS